MVKEVSRTLDPHLAAEIVVLEDGLGRRHHLTIHIAASEKCPACGRVLHKTVKGVSRPEAVISAVKKEMEASENAMRAHAKKRGYKL